jgi:putative copper export protein
VNKGLKVVVVLAAILFFVNGVRWLVAPAGIAPMFGLDLASGVGLSTQVGDMSAFFFTLGACMLIAVISERKTWYYPAIMLLGFAAIARILAWLVHGAAFAGDLILVEIIVTIILLIASQRLPTTD